MSIDKAGHNGKTNKTVHGTDYHQHQGLWLPADLQTGDIICAHMMTKFYGAEKAEMLPRHVMVLGMEMDPHTLEYTRLHVARFSYSKTFVNDDSNLLIPRHYERRGLITGLSDRAVLAADRTDFLPLDADHFWGPVYDIERIGRVDPVLFDEIRETLVRGQQRTQSQSRYKPRDPDKWYVPSAHGAGEDIRSPHPKHDFTALDEAARARIQTDIVLRKDPAKLEAQDITRLVSALDRARQAQARHENWLGRQRHKISVHEPFQRVMLPTSQGAPDTSPMDMDTPDLSQARNPQEVLRMLLPHSDQQQRLEDLLARFNDKAQVPFTKIELPAHMWQGRYIMCKIPDLHDEENDGTAYRPCAVWRAFKDRHTGELAGLELHPVTRGSENTFRYRFQVYPLKTQSQRPGHLIADCIIRVPLNSRYFHEKNASNFFELPPDKLEKFSERRAHALSSGDPVRIFGLKDIPEDWEEVALDPTPSYKQFLKWSEAGKIKFDGAATNRVRERQRGIKPD